MRIVCQFSCGAASAVATKLAIAQYGDGCEIINAYLAGEHADNRRFLADCEAWFGRKVVILRDEKYDADPIEVFRRTRYIKGRQGASCTKRLKRDLLRTFEQPGDVLVLGYTSDEQWRLDDFQEAYPDRPVVAPLIERGLTKTDCKTMVERAGITLPFMYLQGYQNANCIGCVKGGAGYFRAIREDYPEEFKRLADVEAEIGPGAYILRHRSGPLKGAALSPPPVARRQGRPQGMAAGLRRHMRNRRAGIHSLTTNTPARSRGLFSFWEPPICKTTFPKA